MKHSLMNKTLPALLVGSMLGSMSAANADVLLSDWTDEDHFYYYLNHMPDFDQNRCDDMEPTIEGLDNNGRNHCVPTATTNVLKYIAQHGFPHIDPGPSSWGYDFSYNTAGEFIEELGDDMDTNPWGGTSYDDYYAEIVNRLECEFVVKLYIADDDYSPDFKGLARSAINGHLVLVRYGFYNDNGMDDDHHVVSRSGGHMTTFMQAWGWEGKEIMTVRDPGTGGDDCYTQSDYSARSWQVEERLVEVSGERRTQCFLYEEGNYTGSNRYLDGYISIIPNRFYSWGEYDNGIRIAAPIDDLFGLHVNPFIETPFGWSIRDYLPDPRSLQSLAVLQKNDKHLIVELDPNASTMPNTMISDRLINPHVICWGNLGELWAADGGQLKIMRRAGGSGDWGQYGSYDLGSPVDAMVADPENGGVYTIHPTTRRLTYWPGVGTNGQPQSFDVPDGPVLQGKNDLMMNPKTGSLILWNAEARSLWSLDPSGGQNGMVAKQQLIPDMETITGVEIDDLGRLLALRDGKIVAYKCGDRNMWTQDDSHRFNGLVLGDDISRFTMLRSSTNVHGDLEPEELDITPDVPQDGVVSNEVVDCNADLDFDRDVDISDLLTLLSRWGGQHGGLGDIDNDGKIDVMDLLALIEAWGACD